MKIAIPVFENRVSPRFDHAPGVLLVTADADAAKVIDAREIAFQSPRYGERIQQLKACQVDVVICGGITTDMETLFEASSIRVIQWVTGDVQDVLRLFMQHRLVPGTMLCPGRRAKRWRFCSQARGPGQEKK